MNRNSPLFRLSKAILRRQGRANGELFLSTWQPSCFPVDCLTDTRKCKFGKQIYRKLWLVVYKPIKAAVIKHETVQIIGEIWLVFRLDFIQSEYLLYQVQKNDLARTHYHVPRVFTLKFQDGDRRYGNDRNSCPRSCKRRGN